MAEYLDVLLSETHPSFIYITDITSPRLTSTRILSVLTKYAFAHVNAVACFTARLFYDSVLSSYGSEGKFDESLDAFLHGLRAVAKGRKLVLLLEKPERLLPDLLAPLARLAELSQVDITTILLSQVRWEDIKPPLGAAPDPYFIDIPTPTKEDVITHLTTTFSSVSNTSTHPAYHLSLLPLYTHFASLLCSICFPFTNDPNELAYISAARWPGFVQPVLNEHQNNLSQLEEDDPGKIPPPSEDTRIRLTRHFTPSLTAALEALYPRLMNATEWAKANHPEGGFQKDFLHPSSTRTVAIDLELRRGTSGVGVASRRELTALPLISKYIIIASFLASTNPPKSDLRMFGRGLDEKRRKRRARKGPGKSGPAKVPQRLLGPTPFPLDRMIAILGVLLEENDVRKEEGQGRPGEGTEMLINRVQVYASIVELTQIHLLHRTSSPDKLDGPPMFKCGVGWEVAEGLGNELGLKLGEYVWDAV